MYFRGGRSDVPDSRYSAELNVIEATGWTHDEYLAAPWDLAEELGVRVQKRALVEAERVEAMNGG